MKVTVEKLNKLREHNKAVMSGVSGVLDNNEVRGIYEESFADFVNNIIQTRLGRAQDKKGRVIPAFDLSFDAALRHAYGVDMRSYLKQMEIYMGTDTLHSVASRFGNDNLTVSVLSNSLIKHSQFDGLNSTGDINSEWRFIIPEMIMAAIRTDYEASSLHNNWIATTQTVNARDIKMPFIKRGNATPRKIEQAESIPFGTVAFGQKSATLYKVGIGFKLTDELVDQSSLDMLFNFLGEVGTDMSIAGDVEALNILVNGEQEDGSESAPVIGTIDGTTFSYKDIKRGVSRLERLKRPVTRILYGEDDGLDINLLEQFKGFAGGTTLGQINGLMGKILSLQEDVYVMPTNQLMLLAPTKAMAKLKWKGMKTETRRNPQNQEDEIFVSDYIGFAILRRDGRLILDKSIPYAQNGFPSYMDIDSRIGVSFKHIQG